MKALQKLFLFCVLINLGEYALGSKIINGTETKKKSMLYMASVQNDKQGHVCGGFLISKDFVLTAAHCDDWNPTKVVLGTHDLRNVKDAEKYPVKTCKHPYYESVKSGNDIMLLKLLKKARPGKKSRSKTIKFSGSNTKVKDNKKCRVAGWGLTETGDGSLSLRDVEVPVINLTNCETQWHNKLPAKVICAGGYKTGNGFCQGDSGGPLVCDKKAVGIVSFNNGNNCNYPDLPNVYTDISKFVPWINKVLKKKDC